MLVRLVSGGPRGGRGDAGLPVLGSALHTAPGVFIHLSVGSLSRHKADVITTLKERDRTGGVKVGSPAWTITVTYILAHL